MEGGEEPEIQKLAVNRSANLPQRSVLYPSPTHEHRRGKRGGSCRGWRRVDVDEEPEFQKVAVHLSSSLPPSCPPSLCLCLRVLGCSGSGGW